MKKLFRCIIIICMVTLAVLAVTPVSAVQNGTYDNDNHLYVCVVVFYDGSYVPIWRTTGELISPTVVLTAGHGTQGATYASVWFDSDVNPNNSEDFPYDVTGYPYYGDGTSFTGMPYTYPEYNGFYNDVGVVVLDDEGVPTETLNTYALLPEAGIVDTLSMMTEVGIVGYGVQWQKKGVPDFPGFPPGFYPPPPHNSWRWNDQRYYATANLIQSQNIISSEFLTLTANPARGKGGITFGDSGGPVLFLSGDTNIILGVNSFVTNNNCDGVTYAQRIDIQDILDWINSFLD